VTRSALAVAVLLVLAGCSVGVDTGRTPAPGEGQTATVTDVVDGDTVTVRLADGTSDTVRLVGVDTPEVHADADPAEFGVPDTEAGQSCLRRWGERASSFAAERLDGRQITLTFDPNLDRRGYYDRLLAYVAVDENGTLNYALVAAGYARVYDSDFGRQDRYRDAERRAREQDRGLWACATSSPATATPVPDGGAALAIVEVHADAEGNDNENLNDEYVVFENRDEEPLDLSGWTVGDEADHTYTFANLTLDPGERVTLHTGSGRTPRPTATGTGPGPSGTTAATR